MRNLLVLVVLFTSLSAFAENADKANKCLEILTDGHSRDSQTFILNMNEYEFPEFGRDHLAKAIHVIKTLVDQEGCSRQDINFGKGPLGRSHSRCQMLQPGVLSSLACYIQTNLGYFHVTYDYLEHANVFFSRWD